MKKITFGTKLGYGAGDMYAGGAFLLVGLLFMRFMTDVVGVNPALAGVVFLIGKIWDAISDPMMGLISDRTRTRFGRRRVYFLIGIIPILFSFSMLWYRVGNDNQMVMFVYYMLAYVLFNTVFTMVMVPYNGLLANMVTDYKMRTSFNTVRMMFSAFSAILSGVFPMIIVNSMGSLETGYMVMGVVFGAIYATPWIFVFWKTFELPVEQDEEPMSMKKVLGEFLISFNNRSFRIHASFFVAAQSAVDFLTTLFTYYLTYVLDRESEFSAVLGVLLVVQLLCMPIHGAVSKKFGKAMPLKVGLILWLAGLIIAMFITKDSPGFLIYLVAALSGVGGSASIFVPWSILPEISDVDELMTGRRREGIYAGMSTLIRKVAQAISVFIIGVILDQIGYVGNGVQSAGTVTGIRMMFFAGPAVFITLSFIALSRYRMTEDKHHLLMRTIEDRKNGQYDQEEEVVKVCEELTGVDFEEMSRFDL